MTRGDSKYLQRRIPPRWLQAESVEATSFEALGSTGFPPANSPFMPHGEGVTWQKKEEPWCCRKQSKAWGGLVQRVESNAFQDVFYIHH